MQNPDEKECIHFETYKLFSYSRDGNLRISNVVGFLSVAFAFGADFTHPNNLEVYRVIITLYLGEINKKIASESN